MANPDSQRRCVFVGNIPYDASEEQLIQICEEVGPVVSFRLVTDRESGRPKGYGFCEYKDEETALSARRNLQGYEINGRQLRVDFAENDKNADKSREQGRGGPGMVTATDAQRQMVGPSTHGNPSFHQPTGHLVATSAATAMAGALGAAQMGSTQNQFGPGIDPLSHYLSKMSKSQLYEIISDLKAIATQNKEHARQLLQTIPNLSKAIFQAQLMLGLVSPQMLQMPNIRQPSFPPPHPNQQPPIAPPLHSSLPQTQQLAENGKLPSSAGGHSIPQMRHPPMPQMGLVRPTNLAYSSQPGNSSGLLKRPFDPSPTDSIDAMNHPSKLSRRSYGKNVPRMEEASSSEKHAPTLQVTPDVELTLLQQVMSLTPEQLSSLPRDQQEQVLQLQQMLRQQT